MSNEKLKVTPKVENVNYTNYALSTFCGSDGKWYVAKIPFNPLTGHVGQLEKVTIPEGEKVYAADKFKKEAVELGIV